MVRRLRLLIGLDQLLLDFQSFAQRLLGRFPKHAKVSHL
ncbi:MAG: hypothetical protein QOH78_1474, partial [Verrucomicrobiota bacterium]